LTGTSFQAWQATAGGNPNNVLTPNESKAGWQMLFDGRSLTGWQSSGQATWTVEEGAIRSTGQVSGYLRTTKTFENFELSADFLADETMNSAIFVRCPADLKANVSPRTCYEVNIFDPHELFPTGSVLDVHSTLPTRISDRRQVESLRHRVERQPHRRQVEREHDRRRARRSL
jgi:hypothetical protein